MDRFAPNTAALETPRVEGEAMGLFRVVCMISPETDSPAPAMMAARTRGIRMFRMMRISAALPFPSSAAAQSATDIREEPTNRQTSPRATTASAMARSIHLFFRFAFFSAFAVSIFYAVLLLSV